MLASLRIRNLALAEEILWEPASGFVSITGETGAGKSMVIGALKLLLGERADKSMIRSGAEQCTVEAEFCLRDLSEIAPLLADRGVEPCEENRLLLKRSVAASASGRQFVNGSACNLSLLRELGEILVDLHGPHDHQSLFSRKRQTLILDGFAKLEEMRSAYTAARATLLRLQREAEEIAGGDSRSLAREGDLLRHQIEEIDAAELMPDEEEELVARHRAASNAQRVLEVCNQLVTLIEGEATGVQDRLGEAGRLLKDLTRLDERTAVLLETHEQASEAVAELANAIRRVTGEVELDPQALAGMEERLDLIQGLRRKYGESYEQIVAYREECTERVEAIDARTERAEAIEGEIVQAQEIMLEAGKKLTAARKKAARGLEKSIMSQLGDLGFAQAAFRIDLSALPQAGALGLEEAEFHFAPNPGEPEAPLRMIASSGEISRVMLALKSAVADLDQVPVLVFDEIDANVGGEIATKVGAKLADLGSRHQVVCITHLPQVAARARAQYLVEKTIEGERTRSTLRALGADERRKELARMLGGESASALKHAGELLKS